ncbi:toast rack family protein [Sporosarcina aquimarina]|uniref:Toast rack family protein n=1 Tax=Sporosarcina aquimarina TaxID=114975 RepID=A0ABU4G5T9_9BACL|nr:toast rack family protein [Sporosarcina aquimarina]MDW0111007.1 toast rack family protein [Sporosarcina aquimarina]
MKKILIIVIVGMIGLASYWVYDLLKTDRVSGDLSIKKDDAKSLDVDIDYGAGNLLIEGGAKEWVNGDIDTNVKKWYPTVEYKNKRNVGKVEIHQKMKGFSPFGKKKNDWHVQLTNEIPVDLSVEMGVSDAELDLTGMNLRHLNVDAGVGDTKINLADEWQENVDGKFDLGVGDAEIRLPQKTGVKLTVSKGVGSIKTKGFISKGKGVYVNEAYGQTDASIDLNVDVGVGGVTFLLVE